MFKKYSIFSCLLFLVVITTACETIAKQSIYSIQLQIEETNLTPEEKTRAIRNIERRLVSVGAENVAITEEEDQKITVEFQGKIKPQKLRKSFTFSGKLEFFEVCKEKNLLYKYLRQIDETFEEQDKLLTEVKNDKVAIDSTLGLSLNTINDAVFATVPKENRKKVAEKLLQKEPFSIIGLEKKIKFLLGKSDRKDLYELYAVYVTAENNASLDGSYVTDAAVGYDQLGNWIINIQMNADGSYIWEQLTEEVYQNNGNIAVAVDNYVYMAPSVFTGPISGGKTQISGNFTEEEAMDLANAFRAGSIPKMKILQETILKRYFQKN